MAKFKLSTEQLTELQKLTDEGAIKGFINKLVNDRAEADVTAKTEELNAAHLAAITKANEAKDQAVAAAKKEVGDAKDAEIATEKAAKEAALKASADKDAALQQANTAKDAAVAAKDAETAQKTAAEQQRDTALNERAATLQELDTLKKSDAAKATEIAAVRAELVTANAATTAEKARADKATGQVLSFDTLVTAVEKHFGITRDTKKNTFEAIQASITTAFDAVKGKAITAEAAKTQAEADKKAAEAAKATAETDKAKANAKALKASWSKGRLFAIVGTAVVAGCVLGAVAYNKSSTFQSCYKYCADSKVGCKLSDICSFIGKLFNRSASAEISR